MKQGFQKSLHLQKTVKSWIISLTNNILLLPQQRLKKFKLQLLLRKPYNRIPLYIYLIRWNKYISCLIKSGHAAQQLKVQDWIEDLKTQLSFVSFKPVICWPKGTGNGLLLLVKKVFLVLQIRES